MPQRLRRVLRAPLPLWVVLSTLAGIVLLSLLIHLQIALTTLGAWSDMGAYRIQAASVFQHQNVYVATSRYPYPPVWIWIVTAAQWLSTVLHRRFDIMVKMPSILADLGIVVVMYRYLRERIGPCLEALLIPALYAFNPVALIVTAGHGQFDALVVFFVLLALQLRGPAQDRYPIWSALALGVAIALKGYPVLVLPYFALTAPRGQRIRAVVAAFAPLVASYLVYVALFGYTPLMVSNVLTYDSQPDFGWDALVLRTHFAPIIIYDRIARTASISHVLILLFALVVPLWRFRTRPAAAVAVMFLAFYALTVTMSAQYVMWALPFVLVAMPLSGIAYSAAAWLGIGSLYVIRYQSVIPHVSFWEWLTSPLAVYRQESIAVIILVSGAIVVFHVARSLRRGGEPVDDSASPLATLEPAPGAYLAGARQAY